MDLNDLGSQGGDRNGGFNGVRNDMTTDAYGNIQPPNGGIPNDNQGGGQPPNMYRGEQQEPAQTTAPSANNPVI